jgi:SAM-dependent methyltransferase
VTLVRIAFPMEDERARRERERFNKGLQRNSYEAVFSHTHYYYSNKRDRIVSDLLDTKRDGHFLELGSMAWLAWLEDPSIVPPRITCINISEVELEKGIACAKRTVNKPDFQLMDAHNLQFAPGSFDVVFGAGILHHLDLEKALKEIERVLKSDGLFVFTEPLDMNPFGRILRRLTPKARTPDEKPLRRTQLARISEEFKCSFYYEEFFSVPAGVLSRLLFRSPENALCASAFAIDETLIRKLPQLGPYYRSVLIEGRKRSRGSVRQASTQLPVSIR